jgi:virulence-associated protein VagC
MTKSGKGKIISQGPAKTRFISVPSAVAGDSAFPFGDGDTVKVTIEEKRLVVEPVTEEEDQ